VWIDHLHPLSGADEEVNVISQQLVTDIHDEGDCLILHEWTLLRLRLRSACGFQIRLASDWQCGFFSLCNSLRYEIPAL
jgi:hypothetical protein